MFVRSCACVSFWIGTMLLSGALTWHLLPNSLASFSSEFASIFQIGAAHRRKFSARLKLCLRSVLKKFRICQRRAFCLVAEKLCNVVYGVVLAV
jgi:hypothetical protein